MTSRVRVVYAKELIDNLRDRRSLSAALTFTLVGPLVMAGAILLTTREMTEKVDGDVALPVSGADHAPGLVEYLEQHKVRVISGRGDLEALVKRGKHDVALAIPRSFDEDFRSARPATVRLIIDQSRRSAQPSVKRVRKLLAGFGAHIGRLRLLVRGVDPAIADAIALETVDVATPESLAAMLLGMLPFFIVLAIFLGGYYIVVDATAGELERGSLEPLFTNPVARWELIAGKFLAALSFSVVGLAVGMAGFWLIPQFISTEGLGLRIRLEALVLLRIFLLVLPLTALTTAVGMIISTLSKGYKEAQTMLSLLMMLPLIPGLLLTLMPLEPRSWMMCVPILSEQILINELIRGDAVKGAFVAICVLVTFAAALLSLWIATRLYSGERVFVQR